MHKVKRLLALLMAITMVLAYMPQLPVLAASNTSGFAGGSGTAADPYLIETKEHLNNVRNDLDAHYKLIADIIFTETDFAVGGDFYNNGNGWLPIGTGTNAAFVGTFDGDRHTITGLQICINSSKTEYAGLFGFTRNARISNIILLNADVCVKGGYACVGGIAGYTMSTRFDGCESSGTIESSDEAGGVVGYVQGGSITNCHNSATVISSNAGGGIVGATDVSVSKCSNTGDISSIDGSIVGGIVGYLYSGGSVTLSYNTGSISAIENRVKQGSPTTFAGGICGESSGAINNCFNIGTIYAEDAARYAFAGGIAGSGNVYNCYNIGNVSASASATYYVGAGGIVGDFEQATENCYYINTCSKGSGRGTNSAVKCTPEELSISDTYVGFDFTNTWEFKGRNRYAYPTLISNIYFDSDFANGDGSAANPFIIKTKEQLNYVRNYPDAHFKMVANIVFTEADFATDGAFYNNGKGWVPIEEFSGVFDGAGHSIHNLYFDIDTTRNYAGLFAKNAGVIKNLSVENVDFTADATYTNLNKNVSIDVGAIVGHSSGTISNCFTSGTIQAYASLGGTNASTSYTADVCGGGVVGSLSVTGTITNCYNTASVTVKSTASQPTPCAGGIAGEVLGAISNSYNVGIVTASFAGGIAGNLTSSGEISDCYYLEKSTKGVGYGVDNCVKCTLENMIQASTYSGFDFTNTWTFNDQNGYPYPVLQNGVVPTLQNNITEFAGGTGLPWNPYLISTKEHLNNVRNHLDACFKLTCDIEFNDADFKSGGMFYNSGKGWKPLGDHWNSTFKGTFDGNNKKIINLQINDAINTDRDTGLFGYNSGIIKNVIISDSHIASTSYPSNIGCIIGQNEYKGIVENCITINSKLTSSAGDAIGGIVGYNEGIIRGCTNQATITSSTAARVGGICGSNAGGGSLIGLIQCCNNSGKITLGAPSEQGARVGGIAGSNGSESIIEYSANTGAVYANAESALVGGIAGELYGTIQQCYNTGSVEVTTKNTVYAGGILGLNESGTIENSYNTASVSGVRTGYSGDVYVGGIVGKHKSVLDTLNCYTLGSISGKGSSSATYIGYVCGYNATSTIENCYYLGIADSGAGFGDYSTMYGKNVAVLKNQNTYTRFDFTDIWTIAGNSDYPFPELLGTSMVYEKEVNSIQIDTMPTKLTYIENYEPLNVAGGTIKVTYKYDEYDVISLADATVSGFDNSVVGKQSITVSYLGYTTEFEVEILKKSLDRIEVTTLPDKITYYMGETLSTEGLVVTAYYNDNTSEVVTNYSVSGAASILGINAITVEWQGKICSFDITVTCVPGDIDGDKVVTQDDAVYLLLHTMFGETFYPLINAPADIDGSGVVDQDDAVYLLLHTMFGESFYPLNTPALPAKTEE